MRGMIAYLSRYGATEQYAVWLGEDTGLPVLRLRDVTKSHIDAAPLVLIGSNVRAGRLSAGRWIRRHWPQLQGRHVLVFSVGLRPAEDPETLAVFERGLGSQILSAVQTFVLPGRLKPDALSFLERKMLAVAARAEADPDARVALTDGIDMVERHRLAPLLDAVAALGGSGKP